MGDKKLTINVASRVDPSVAQLGKTLDDIATKGAKISKSFQGMGGGGQGGGAANKATGLAKSLLDQKRAFEALGESGTKLTKILNDQVLKSQASLAKQLELSTSKIDPLIKRYEAAQIRLGKLKRSGVDPSRLELAERYADRARHDVISGVAERQRIAAAAGMDGSGGEGGEGGGVGGRMMRGLMGRAGMSGMGMMGGILGSMGIPGVIGGAIVAAATIAAKTIVTAQTTGVMVSAESGTVQASYARAARGMDIRKLYGLAMIDRDPSLSADIGSRGDLGITGARMALSTGASMVPAALMEGATNPGAAAYLPGIVGIGARAMVGARSVVGLGTKRLEARLQEARLERAEKVSEGQQSLLDLAQNNLDTAATRFRTDARFGRGGYVASLSMAQQGKISEDEIRGYYGSVAPMVGTYSAIRYGGRVLGAALSGMDPGQAANIIGRTAVTGGDILGRFGGLDPTIRGILGESVANTMGINSMMYQGAGGSMASILAGGVTTPGGPMGVRQANMVAAGASAYGKLMSGQNAYQKSTNLALSAEALGAGASPWQLNFLANRLSDPKILSDVLAGKLPQQFADIGISIEQAQHVARGADKSMTVGRWMDTGGNTKADIRMRAIAQAGGVGQYIQSRRGEVSRTQLMGEMMEAAPIFDMLDPDMDGGQVGLLEQMSRFGLGAAGMGGGGRRRGGLRGRGRVSSEGEDALLESVQEKASIKLRESEISALNELNTTIKLSTEQAKAQERLGRFFRSYDAAMGATKSGPPR